MHPSELNGTHVGALVRWEDGKTIHQGHLESVEHGYDLPYRDGTVEIRFTPTPATRFTISGAVTTVTVYDSEASIEIIKERS